ncbi:Pyridoxal phosphate enzyme, YggS family protein [Pandoraea horticolens]|uniref:Pyridoxal phosphate enzyme, YggS family protein n=1 Tax=Pandoraea horticolens TaxID=2508298 RepID=A0A5E4VUM1_9BURK|nr:hypothetical protein [Pandoraea horticolens]VVE14720.1 Pyridoxal phosphate enzyme, YggS family protein [Pandoraea horticolens]
MSIVADTQIRHDKHGRYPEATTIEDFRRNLACWFLRVERLPKLAVKSSSRENAAH